VITTTPSRPITVYRSPLQCLALQADIPRYRVPPVCVWSSLLYAISGFPLHYNIETAIA
jgi:hypothetical protein